MMNSVQKNSKLGNFCTEFLLFAYLTKIRAFYIEKFPVFVFLGLKSAFLIQTEHPEQMNAPGVRHILK